MPNNHVIDPILDHYQTFYDVEWATRLNAKVEGTKVAPHVFNLCESWKALGNVFRMPWLLIFGMKSFRRGGARRKRGRPLRRQRRPTTG